MFVYAGCNPADMGEVKTERCAVGTYVAPEVLISSGPVNLAANTSRSVHRTYRQYPWNTSSPHSSCMMLHAGLLGTYGNAQPSTRNQEGLRWSSLPCMDMSGAAMAYVSLESSVQPWGVPRFVVACRHLGHRRHVQRLALRRWRGQRSPQDGLLHVCSRASPVVGHSVGASR